MSREQLMGLLVRLIREPAAGVELSDREWEDVVHVLRDCGLLGTLGALAEQNGVLGQYKPYARRHLVSMLAYSNRQARQVKYECRMIDERLRSEGIETVFLKGAGYTLRGSLNSAGRVYSDIDVLVPRAKLDRARNALARDAWYTPAITDYDERYYRKWAHELPPMKHLMRRTVIDVHHNIVPPISGRAPGMDSLLEGLVYTPAGLAVLSAPAATLHSMVHLFTNEDFSNSFRDLVDLYLLIEEYGDDEFWSKLLALAERTGFARELCFGVVLLRLVLEYQVPDWVIDKLQSEGSEVMRSFLVHQIFRRALKPHHSGVCGMLDTLAIQGAYLRGHWIKMPLSVLLGHLIMKGGITATHKLLGKYRAEPALTVPPGEGKGV